MSRQTLRFARQLGLLALVCVMGCGSSEHDSTYDAAGSSDGFGQDPGPGIDDTNGDEVGSDDGDVMLAVDAEDAAASDSEADITIVEDAEPPPPPCTPGDKCDDGDPCTAMDHCGADATCIGAGYLCDDGRDCTIDSCDGNGDCQFVVKNSGCLIANVCYAPGAKHVENACVVCDPTASRTEWSLASDGASCGTGDPCLTAGTCQAGQCSGAAIGCDDGNACTDDACDGFNGCAHTPNFDPCSDGDACTQGDVCDGGLCTTGLIVISCNDKNPCTIDACGPGGCLNVPSEAIPCDDGNECSSGDACAGGSCVGQAPVSCDDGNLCSQDACDPLLGCMYELVDNVCCIGGLSVCDDQNPCTTDMCNEADGTCSTTPSTASCDDGQPCSGPDHCQDLACVGPPLSCDDGKPCTKDTCSALLGECVHENVAGACSDGNACTAADTCNGGVCLGKKQSCDDANFCTDDSCHPIDGCQHVQKAGACDDGDACTTGTTCSAAGCKGATTNCDDQNPCTNDSCHPVLGCKHQSVGGPCNDGLACSTNDTCSAGTCQGNTAACGCIPEFSDVVSKLTKFNIGTGGVPGQGLDVDKNPATCSPAGSCSGGIDNQLSSFAPFANGPLDKAVQKGSTVLMFEHQGFKSTGQTYTLAFYTGDPVDKGSCDVQTETCDYKIDPGTINSKTCQSIITFTNAKIVNGTTLKAGGKGFTFPFEIPLSDDASLPIVLSNAEIVATVSLAGGAVTALTGGVLAGAIPKETFLAGVDGIDESGLPSGLTKAQLKQLIDALVQNDIDTNGDGKPDAASIALTFTGIAGHIVGVK